MLSTIRNNKKSVIVIVIAGFMAIVMGGFGLSAGGAYKGGRDEVVIRVDGHEIDYATYEDELARVNELYRSQLGQNYNAMRNFLNIEQRAIDSLIEQRISQEFVSELGLSASTAQMEGYLAQLPFFQKNGLTRETYDMFIRAQGLTGEDMEEKLKQEISELQFQTMLADLNRPTDQELKSVYRERNAKLDFDYVAFRPTDFEKKVDTNDEARVKQYFEGYSDKYKKPRTVRYTYVKFDPTEFLGKVEVTPEDLQALYLQKQSQFYEPKELKLRQIVFNKEKKESSALEAMVTGEEKNSAATPANEAKKNTAKTLVERLKAGEDFSTLAKEASEDAATKANGGDRGWILASALDKDVRAVADRVEKGKYSDVIETENQFVIVFIDDIKERRLKPFDTVRPQLEAELRSQDAPEYARVEAENFNRRWLDNSENRSLSLADFAKKENREVKTSERLLASGEDPADAPGLTAKLISRSQGDRDAIHAGAFDYVFEIAEAKDAYVPEFESIKEQVKADFIKTESKLIARREAEKARAALTAADGKKTLQEIAKEYAIEVKSVADFSRGGDAGKDPLVMNPTNRSALFAMTSASPVAESFLTGGEGEPVIAVLKSKVLPDDAEFSAKLPTVRTEETQSAKMRLSTFVSQSLRAAADVWVSPKLLENRAAPFSDDNVVDL